MDSNLIDEFHRLLHLRFPPQIGHKITPRVNEHALLTYATSCASAAALPQSSYQLRVTTLRPTALVIIIDADYDVAQYLGGFYSDLHTLLLALSMQTGAELVVDQLQRVVS